MDESDSVRLNGSCFCGSITFSVSSPAILRAYCHCTNCQRLTGCPFIHTAHFPDPAFTWTHIAPVESKLDSFVYASKSWKTRYRCKSCGVNIASYNSRKKTWSLWGGNFARDDEGRIKSWDEIKPDAHIFYGTRMLDIADELGKWEGYPDASTKLG